MVKTDYRKEFNLMAKRIFSEWLLEATKNNDQEMFDSCVLSIGKEWNVLYHLKRENRPGFLENLWNHKDKILNGTYDRWSQSDFNAYTYESKVCFLLNPRHYKIICDTNTRQSISEAFGGIEVTYEGWQALADRYYSEILKKDTKDMSDAEIFEVDFNLWNVE